MPFIRLSTLERRALFTTSISLNKEIMSPCSCYTKKGLVYIAITFPFSSQPSSYLECTKANTYLLCNVRLVSLNKYIFPYCYTRLCTRYSLLVP